jgi:hypothetical protein
LVDRRSKIIEFNIFVFSLNSNASHNQLKLYLIIPAYYSGYLFVLDDNFFYT